jgi:hypothetical protein
MSVDDDAYARLVRMHSDRRQTGEASEGLASFAEKRAAKWGREGSKFFCGADTSETAVASAAEFAILGSVEIHLEWMTAVAR